MSNLLRIKELEAQVERKDKYILELENKLNTEVKELPVFLKEQA